MSASYNSPKKVKPVFKAAAEYSFLSAQDLASIHILAKFSSLLNCCLWAKKIAHEYSKMPNVSPLNARIYEMKAITAHIRTVSHIANKYLVTIEAISEVLKRVTHIRNTKYDGPYPLELATMFASESKTVEMKAPRWMSNGKVAKDPIVIYKEHEENIPYNQGSS